MPRNDMSLLEKENVLKQYDLLEKCTQRQAAEKLGVSQSLLNKLLKTRHEIESAENKHRKRNRSGKDEDLEKILKKWYVEVLDKNVPVNGPMLKLKAVSIAEKLGRSDFKVTDGWFSRWLRRESIVLGKPRGDQLPQVDEKISADQWIAAEWPGKRENYAPRDVYNAHETGLYFRAMPGQASSKEKERVTLLCCASMLGEKSTLLVIGEKGHGNNCLENVKRLPVDFEASKNACMTREIFTDWLRKWNERLAVERRRILLLVSSHEPAHSDLPEFDNIKIVNLPTSLVQPCDQGIIRMFKVHYRKEMLKRTIEFVECNKELRANDVAKKITLLEALHLASEAWNLVSSETIVNCFKTAGFSPRDSSCSTTDNNAFAPPEGLSEATFNDWLGIDENFAHNESNSIEEADDQNDDREVEDQVQKVPTNEEMLNALNVLRRGVQHYADSFVEHYVYEKFILQLIKSN